ncbi:MAG: hypothetical protein ACKO0N_15810 [Planctomycetota bacterium]
MKKLLLLPLALLAVTAASTLSAQTQTWSYSSSSSSSSSFGTPPAGFSGGGFAGGMSRAGLPGFQQGEFATSGQAFTASYRNTPAVDVVLQLATLADVDPRLTESSLEALKSAEPITRQFRDGTPRKALDEVLKSLDLSLIESGDELVLNAGGECSRTRKVLDLTLRTLGLDAQLQRPFPLMAFQTPLRMFLQSASMQLGVEIEVDYQKLKVSPQSPISIQPFSAETLGESLQAGLASAGLKYRVTGGKLVIGHRAD